MAQIDLQTHVDRVQPQESLLIHIGESFDTHSVPISLKSFDPLVDTIQVAQENDLHDSE